MIQKDIRWIQRFDNYNKALKQLTNAVDLTAKRKLSELEKQGFIQAFEYTHELAWQTIKDFLKDQGNVEIYGSKDATREAFKLGLIKNGDIWMDMIQSRNKTSHTYNEETANEIINIILKNYITEYNNFFEKFKQLKAKEIK